MLYAGCIILFAVASELFTHAVFQLIGVHISGAKKMVNWYCREDEGEQSTPLLQLPPLCNSRCGVWLSYRKRM